MEMRVVEPIWQTEESATEASRVERLEAQVEALTRKVGRLERRQQRFTDMVRLLLELHDRMAIRLKALDGHETNESIEELTGTAEELVRGTAANALPRTSRPRRVAARRPNV
jgi:hypothetical protein